MKATSPSSSGPAPKRHHFVPEMLQKRFVDSEGWLHAFSRRRPDGNVYPVRPSKLFVETHLYSSVEVDGSRDTAAEAYLSRLEDLADPVVDKIVAAARRGDAPGLTSRETEIWNLFTAIQWKRVPDLHPTVTPDTDVHDAFDELIGALRLSHPHFSAELDALQTPEARLRMVKNARVHAATGTSDEVLDALRGRGLAIAVIRQPGKQFVLATRPVVKLTAPGKTDLRHPECELWLPVASDVVVGLGRGEGTETVLPITSDQVRHLNTGAVGQSTAFASGSAALTQSLSRPR